MIRPRLVPRPGKNLVRYKGVFASNSSFRRLIVPRSPRGRSCRHGCGAEESPEASGTPGPGASAAPEAPAPAQPPSAPLDDLDDTSPFEPEKAPTPRTRYLDWASLLRRVYGSSALVCDRCGGPLKVVAFIEDKKVVRQILDHLGLAATGPPQASARPRPQLEMFG